MLRRIVEKTKEARALINHDQLSVTAGERKSIEQMHRKTFGSINPMKNLDQLISMVENHTLLDPTRLKSLWRLVSDINRRGVEGDIVECGSYKGGSSAILKACMGPNRRLWLYDSFQGLPEPAQKNGDFARGFAGDFRAAVSDVVDIMTLTGVGLDQLVINEGWFEDTFKRALPEKVALLHCDADWYDSVLLVLDTFYPLMPDGACVILDDFGHWEGCRVAFYEFCEKYCERPLLERVGYSQSYWIKGKEYNIDR